MELKSTPSKDKKREIAPVSSPKVNYGPLAAILVTIISYVLIAQVAVALVASIYVLISGGGAEDALESLQAMTTGQFVIASAAYGGMLFSVWLFMRLRKVSFAAIGLNRKPVRKDAGYALMAFLAYVVLLIPALGIAKALVPSLNLEQEQQLSFEPGSQGFSILLIFIALVVLPPIIEEIIMRGFLYTGLRRSFKILPAALITSALFAAPHMQLESGAPPLYVAAIDTFILSLVLVYVREKTGSLWSSMLVHAMKNGIAFLALFVFAAR